MKGREGKNERERGGGEKRKCKKAGKGRKNKRNERESKKEDEKA